MRNLTILLTESLAENKQDALNEKLIFINDIIRIKKTLWAFGYTQHDEWIYHEAAGKLFDSLYDMELEALKIVNSGYEKQINEHLSNK